MKIISKGKIALLLSFSCVALVSGGFSSWIIGNPDPVIQGMITVGDVVSIGGNVIDLSSIKATGFTGVQYKWGIDNKNSVVMYDDPLKITVDFNINKSNFNSFIQNKINQQFKIDIKSKNNYSIPNVAGSTTSVFEFFNNTAVSFKINSQVINGTLSNNWGSSVPVFKENTFIPTYTYSMSVDQTFNNAISNYSTNLVPCSFSMDFEVNETPKKADGSNQSDNAYNDLIIKSLFGIINAEKRFSFEGTIALGGNQ